MSEVLPVVTGGGAVEVGSQWLARYDAALMGVFGTPRRVLVRGEGCYVWDADGKRYLDLLGGIAVNALGHAHPTLTAAVCAQLGTLGHVSNFFTSPVQVALAERLLEISGASQVEGSRVFLVNSGTEANEAAFKVARRTGRPRILALEGAFHGRTMGALALTHKAVYREPFAPLPGGVEHVAAGDVAALESAMGSDVAAIVLEVVQGEAGVRRLPPGYLTRARQLADQYGALLVLDEVQTGVGRTGAWFAHQHPDLGEGVRPDVMTLAKGLGGGVPVGALVAYGPAATLLGAGQHGTTFGGNPLASAAALATLAVIERDDLLAQVRRVGAVLRDALGAVPMVREVRGTGLLLAIEIEGRPSAEVADLALDAGFVVNPVTPTAIRLAPPLVLTEEQAMTFVDFLGALEGTS